MTFQLMLINKEKLNEKVIKMQNEMIRKYEPRENEMKIEIAKSEEEIELYNEIQIDIQNDTSSAENVLNKICKLAEIRYNSCETENMEAINEIIKKELCTRAEKEVVDTILLRRIIHKIILNDDKSISMELINRDVRKGGYMNGCKYSI